MFALSIIFLSIPGKAAASTCDNAAIEGTVVKVEVQPIEGELLGFNEYTYKGVWNGGMAYKAGDTVLYGGIFWRSASDGSGQAPSCSTGAWKSADAVKYENEHAVTGFSRLSTSPWGRSLGEGSLFSSMLNYQSGLSGCSGYGFLEWYDVFDERRTTSWVYNPDCSSVQVTTYSIQGQGPYTYTSPSCINRRCYHDVSLRCLDSSNISITPSRFSKSDSGVCIDGDGYSAEESVHTRKTLSKSKTGLQAFAERIAQLNEEDWMPGWSSDVSWLGAWEDAWSENKFAFKGGRAVRYWLEFPCSPKDEDNLEFTYWEWPVGCDEENNGKEIKETKSAGLLRKEKQEDGRIWFKGQIDLRDGYCRRLLKVVNKSTCGGDDGGGAGNGNGGGLDSMWWWVSLGKLSGGLSAGRLWVEQSELTVHSATPSALRSDLRTVVLTEGATELVKIIKDDSGRLRQILAPEAFVDVVIIDEYSYEIRFYDPADAEEEKETLSVGAPETPDYMEVEALTGFYMPVGLPFSVWKVENPDGSSAHNRLQITHVYGEGNESYLFEQNGSNWILNRSNGLRRDELVESIVNGDLQEVRVVKGADGVPCYKALEIFHNYAFGKRLIKQVEDPDGAALTTSWTYYDNPDTDGGAYGHLKEVINSDGSWSRHYYDSQGRETKRVSSYLDAAPGASENASRVITTNYSENAGVKTATIVETVQGAEVGRRYGVKSADGSEIKSVVCTTAGAAINDAANLVTITRYVTGGDFDGEVASVTNPDGTMTIYNYISNNGVVTTTESFGQPNGGGTAIVAGKKTIRIENALGHLMSEETCDIISNLVLESFVVSERDEFGRSTRIDYGDGTAEEKSYSCCGMEWEKNRDGIVTNYTHDDLGRIETMSRAGITTIYSYDGSGRVLTTTRQGSGNSDIVLEANTYDLAGRRTSSKDALNQTTTYSEGINGSGQRIHTTLLPGGGTRVEITHRDGQPLESGGSAAHPRKYEYGVSGGELWSKEIRVGAGGSDDEWVRTYRDAAGRTSRVEYPGGAAETYHYNSLGQLVKQVDADGIARLYSYNAEGEQVEQVLDADGSGTISAGDRRIKTERSVVSGPLLRTITQEGTGGGYVTGSVVDASPNGRYRKETRYGLETVTEITRQTGGNYTEEITHPDGSVTTNLYEAERLASSVRENGGAVASTTYGYDAHGRLASQTDGRVNTVTAYTYNAADQVTQVNAGGMITGYTYNALGQITTETLPGSGRTITRSYLPTGEVTGEGGTAAYPVSYTYDPQGRRTSMTTSSGTTTWSYDNQRGWLTGKTDADGKTVSYTHTAAGRLSSRAWARGITTSYAYNGAGELASISYSDGTPGVTLGHDERGRVTAVSDAAGSRTLSYTAAGQPVSESLSGGIADGLGIEIGYDGLLRRNSSAAKRGGITLVSASYSYDGASRLAGVSNGAQSAAYSYLANSSLVSQIAFGQGGTAMTTTKSYDSLDRLSAISSAPAAGNAVSYAYQYDSAGQRSQVTHADGAYWVYGYNARGEVIGGGKKNSSDTDLNGYQFGYAFDAIGNRISATDNGRTSDYSPNALNQYTARTVPGYVNVLGEANPSTTVTVNGQNATRQDKFYHKELTVDNSSDAVYLTTEVVGTLGGDTAERIGKIFVPETPETYSYDADGNLLSDGRWNYAWDGENRLIAQETTSGAVAGGAPKQRLTFAYDYMGRRISKKVERKWNGSAYQDSYTMLFVWDGWNVVAEVLAGGPKVRTYVWGNDLSGTPQGAGGIGGLLFINQYPENKSYSVGYDGNGNVTGLFDMGASGSQAAYYEYGPFGEPVVVSGAFAEINPFRWSTKYTDNESGLVGFQLRPDYNPIIGKFLSCDPIGELGGLNLYTLCENDLINKFDPFGLTSQLPEHLKCCKIKRLILNFNSTQSAPNHHPPIDAYWNHPTGSVFVGTVTVECQDKNIWTGSVQTGGMRTRDSTVFQGDDSATPAGDHRISTSRPGQGFPIYTITVPTTGRGNITMHYAEYHGSHGCPTLRNEREWEELKELMKLNKDAFNIQSAPIRIQYSGVTPHGTRGGGRNDPLQVPVGIPTTPGAPSP